LRTTVKKQSENISHILALPELIDIADFLAGVEARGVPPRSTLARQTISQ
jgi:hypothetical protein